MGTGPGDHGVIDPSTTGALSGPRLPPDSHHESPDSGRWEVRETRLSRNPRGAEGRSSPGLGAAHVRR